ncbi:hypothetical protein GCM10023258_15620 [Terrabacter aeriphilus]|uniref:Uncharacterized protein n=1 Tax=Terrabacter aeriphilus TaxID=515662 RepID=A0ABP9J8I3_9MICO
MRERMRTWSRRRRVTFVLRLALASFLIRHAVLRLTDSPAVHLTVSTVLVVVLGWVTAAFFRVLLAESAEEAERNPRPW